MRSETTDFLGRLLADRRLRGTAWAAEVSVRKFQGNLNRIDYLAFKPEGQSLEGIERGKFLGFEVKSCIADLRSGHGHNAYGDKNWVVCPMSVWMKESKRQADGPSAFDNPDLFAGFGVLVPIHKSHGEWDEAEDPIPLGGNICDWRLTEVRRPSPLHHREYGQVELLYAIMRAMRPGVMSWEEG